VGLDSKITGSTPPANFTDRFPKHKEKLNVKDKFLYGCGSLGLNVHRSRRAFAPLGASGRSERGGASRCFSAIVEPSTGGPTATEE